MDSPAASDLESVTCVLCGTDDAVLVLTGQDWLHGLPGTFRVVRCRHCELVYQNPRPTASAISRFYPPEYVPHRSDAAPSRVNSPRRRLIRSLLRHRYGYGDSDSRLARLLLLPIDRLYATLNLNLLPYRRGGRLLDVGCGAGTYLRSMRDLGWQARGIDFNPSAVRAAREAFGLDVTQIDLIGAAFPPESFDVVTMWWYLEHVPNPREVLREAYRILRHGGLIALGVPNWDSLERRIFGRAWYHLDLPRHFYLYDRWTLTRLLKQAGFHEIRTRTGSWLDDPAYSIDRWQQIHNPKHRRLPRAARLVLSPAAWLAARFGYGSLLIAHARKA